jgi:hypothetical protein
MASLACGKFCGDTSPRGFRIALGEEQCKGNRRGERYEGHDEREAGRGKQEAAGAGAPVRSCECASRGARIAQDRTRKALRADVFSARLKSCPFTKAAGWRSALFTSAKTGQMWGTWGWGVRPGRARECGEWVLRMNQKSKAVEKPVPIKDRDRIGFRILPIGNYVP